MLKYTILLLVVSVFLRAEITLHEITEKPTSRAKDFLIWQYLKQNITDKEANKAYRQSTKKNYKLKRRYERRTLDPYIIYSKKCRKKRNLFKIHDEKCFKLALSPYKTLALNNKERKKLEKKVNSKRFVKLLKIQSEPYSAKAYREYPADTILKMFINTTASHRRKNLNLKLDKDFMNHLASSRKIHYFIRMIMQRDKLDKLQKSLLLLDSPKLSAYDNFSLALHHLKYNKKRGAIKHLKVAYFKSTKSTDLDRINFWLYYISKKSKYIDRLLSSDNINVYTLYAHDIQSISVTNYFTTLVTTKSNTTLNLQDPFEWNIIRQKIKQTPKNKLFDLAQKYQQTDLLPLQSIILEKAYAYKKHSYIMPFREYLSDVSSDDKALVYAIMRQESNFIPSALSSSFALGLMQIMPFLVDALSKEMKTKIKYSDMFKPEVNLKYALKHLKWMKKSFTHPLFMAYVYNGGIGFFKKHLRTGAFSSKKYEPYLSMELMNNSQSREYGKRVLANYVMYKKVLGEEISIIRLFQRLTGSTKTGRS